ncbi:MAG: reverse transcriptase domain-containing protein [Phormidesmis sp.]
MRLPWVIKTKTVFPSEDAVAAIFRTICQRPKYVLEGDIKGCFNNISHQALLEKVKAPPFIPRLLSAWLKCGVIERGFQPTEKGTPQGGVDLAFVGVDSSTWDRVTP